MKKEIHPQYHKKATVTCVCGNTFIVGATRPAIKVGICSNCHPLYTGKQSLIDTAGRVERFKARQSKIKTKPAVKKSVRRAVRSKKRASK